MSFATILIIALALAMDAFAISIASGALARQFKFRHALTMGAWFGGFQAIMPFLGWLGGTSLKDVISGVDHWVAFGLLLVIGCKMIYEAYKIEDVEKRADHLSVRVMFVLAVATSIDALAVGVTFAMIGISIITPVLIIGLVTFVVSFAGVWIGCRGLGLFGKKMEIVGGLILIGIGVKILLDHLLA